MIQSRLFTKTQKDSLAEETSAGTQYLIRGGFIDKLSAGVYTILPLGLRVLRKIETIITEQMDNLGAQRILMPALTPKKNWEITGRWDSLDVLYKVESQRKEMSALGATHEEIVTPLGQKFSFSYRDFPFSVYQIQTKFRDELRAKSGLLRGREFLMKDLYSFHVDEKDCDKFYDLVKEAYFSIYNQVGLAPITYLTLASGGTFSKFSHEFQTVAENGEDLIYICDNCGVAINREIKNEYPKCPECGCDKFSEKKAIEVGNIFKLGVKYSSAFCFTAKGSDGQDLPVLMNCYGIGLTRLMGTIAEASCDPVGIIWPKSVAPFNVHLLGLNSSEETANIQVREICGKVYTDLQSRGIDVLYDDRTDKSAGEKFKDADLLGIPWRVVASQKSLAKDCVEIKRRGEKEAILIELNKLGNFEF